MFLKSGTVQDVTQAVPLLLKLPMERLWVDHDKEADVLYISFRRPQQATDTTATDEGILLRYRGKELVGITVLEASSRVPEGPTSLTGTKKPVTKKRKQPRKRTPAKH